MESPINPIFLLADSQLLFWREAETLFLNRVQQLLEPRHAPTAAYLGASNGDEPAFFQLFVAAMQGIAIEASACRHIPAHPTAEDHTFLAQADLILLAGGDPWQGWQAFTAQGIPDLLVTRYYQGAVLLGVSAGAMHLGLQGWGPVPATEPDTFEALKLVPFVIDAHAEPEWHTLKQVVKHQKGYIRGLGIPSGGGAIYYHGGIVEPIRRPLIELSPTEQGLQEALLLPEDKHPDFPCP